MTALGRGVGALPRWLVLSIGALALLAVLGLPTIVIPFATDQVWFALGARTILDGNQLYADFWDQKPPLIYLLYAIPFALAGEHMEAVRVFDLLNVFAGMAGVFFLGRRLFGERSGVFAAALYAFAYLSWTQPGDLGETESFMAAPLAFAFALYLPDDARPDAGLRAVVAGLLLSVVFSFKAPAILFLLALPAAEVLLRREGSWSIRGAAGRLALAVVGFAVVPVALALYMALGGVLDDFLNIQRDYTVHYNAYRYAPEGVSHLRFVLDTTSQFVQSAAFLVVPAAAALLLAFFRLREARGVALLALLALLGLTSVWWQGKMFTYHWVVMVPLLAPLAGYALDRLGALFATLPRGRAFGAWLLLTAGLIVLAYPTLRDTYDDYRVLVRYADGSMSRREVEAHYYPLYPPNRDVVDYVRANSGPNDRIYIFGLWPQVDFWLDREPFNRFTVNSGLRATWSPQKYRDELMRDLRAAPPRYFAIGLGDNQPWLVGTSQTSDEYVRDDFPELLSFLAENYDLVRNFGPMVLLERRPVAV